jgi:hypothetical protein
MEIDNQRFMKNRKTIVFLVLFMELFCNGTGQGEKMNSGTKVKEESSIEMKKELQKPLDYVMYVINNQYGIFHIDEADKSNGAHYYILDNENEKIITFAIPFLKKRPQYKYKAHNSSPYYYFQLPSGKFFRFSKEIKESILGTDYNEITFDISNTIDGFDPKFEKNTKGSGGIPENDVDFHIKEAELKAEGYYDYPYDHLEDLPESE